MKYEFNITQSLYLLRRRWFFLVCGTILGCIIFYIISAFIIMPKYTSIREMYVSNVTSQTGELNYNDITASQKLVNTCVVILENQIVMNKVVEELDGRITDSELKDFVTISTVNDTEVLRISITTEDPQLSADICNTYVSVAKKQLKSVLKVGTFEGLAEATPSTEPSSPQISRNTVIGGIIGFVLSVLLVFLLYFLDNTIKSEEDIKQRLNLDIPVLGEIPRFRRTGAGKNLKSKTKLAYAEKNISNLSQVLEAYKLVRTNLLFTLSSPEKNTIAITSAEPSSGKSTTCTNIAVTMAQVGAKTVIVDADMRRPTQHTIFQVANSKGLSTLLAGANEVADVKYTNVEYHAELSSDFDENLDLIPAGPIPPNPSELLGSWRMKSSIDQLSNQYDYIFIDTPPVNIVADSLMLSDIVAGILFVVRQKQTRYYELKKAVEMAEKLNTKILGIVITDMDWKYTPYKSYKNYEYEY